jgi:site-specific DNA-methyltransferase (adenine-specific)
MRTYRLVFADPPFNIGYDYDSITDLLSAAEFKKWCESWIAECIRLVSHDGAVVVCMGDSYVAQVKIILDGFGLTMRNWIVWHYTFGVHCEGKFGRDHTHILYYVRNPDNFYFNGDAVRIQSERLRIGDKRADPRGRVPGDVWSIPRLVGNAKERVGHPCQMPVDVLDRLIQSLTEEGDIILDPFAGSGTTLASALANGRRADGVELSQQYIEQFIVPRVSDQPAA